jgi:simple sugar transport system permease protein
MNGRRLGNTLLSTFATLLPSTAIVLALIVLILLSLGKDPAAALSRFMSGALGNPSGIADVIMTALPMLLCASGLLLTYTAGLWNIGVEGQVTMGAIFATIIARQILPTDTSPFIIPAELALAMVGGALWAGLAALLKIFGTVNEIFGGVALNFIAVNVLLSLVNGPWKAGSYPQTAPFAAPALLPRLEDLRLSPAAIMITAVAFLVVFFILRGTRWGLQLRAMGKSERSAFLLGVRTRRSILLSMMLCGALAGLAGGFRALLWRERLMPGISGGIGFMGVLIVLLVNVRAVWVPLVALLLAVVPVGTLQVASAMEENIKIDVALGNVFQSALVLTVLLANGVRDRILGRRHASADTAEPVTTDAPPVPPVPPTPSQGEVSHG